MPCQILGYELLEILPKHLLQILGPSNRHGPYMPQAEAVANERNIFVETTAETLHSSDKTTRIEVPSRKATRPTLFSHPLGDSRLPEALSETHLSFLCSPFACCYATAFSLPGNQVRP